MSKKGFINKTLAILVVIFAATTAYLLWTRESSAPETSKQKSQTAIANWNALTPDVYFAIQQALPKTIVDAQNVTDIGDVTNDGISEATAHLSSGATTDFFTLMKLDGNGKPTVALFKGTDGKIEAREFSSGVGGAGRYGSAFGPLPAGNGVYFASYSNYGEEMDHCTAEVYAWDKAQNLFTYNKNLSDQKYGEYCPENMKPISQ